MKLNKEYTVDFAGLKQGVHEYAFEVNKTFFSVFDNEDYNDAAFKIEVVLEKQSTMLIFHFSIKGKVNVDCDRCLEPVDVKVTCEDKLIVKFGSEHETDSEELVVIPESDYQIDLSPYIYEFILVNIPQKRKHKKKDCNPEVLQRLKEIKVKKQKEQEEEIDLRWAQLINLKTEN